MKAREVLADAVATLKASTAIDHWQRDREEIEADELLGYALGVDRVAPNAEVPAERPPALRSDDRPSSVRRTGSAHHGPRRLPRVGDRGEARRVRAARLDRVPRGAGGQETAREPAPRRLRPRDRRRDRRARRSRTRSRGSACSAPTSRTTAIRVARENAELLRLRATFAKGDLFGGLPKDLQGRVDVITLHPPYVARDEVHELPEEIRRFEPVHTLTDRSRTGSGSSAGLRPRVPGG